MLLIGLFIVVICKDTKYYGKRAWKTAFFTQKWPLGRKWLLRLGHCHPKQVTVNPFSFSDLQHLQTDWLLSTEIRKTKMSHCHIVAVRRSNRSTPHLPPERSPLHLPPREKEPPPTPPKGKGAPSNSPEGESRGSLPIDN